MVLTADTRGILNPQQGASHFTLTRLAIDLGYFDLAHFTGHFGRNVGRTPAAFMRACAAGVRRVRAAFMQACAAA
jgi:AraC-like DNA-binding protein